MLDHGIMDGPESSFRLNTMIPTACRFIVKSGKIINRELLRVFNDVLENSVFLFIKEFKALTYYHGFKEIFCIVLSPNEKYFNSNNQIDLDENGQPCYYPPSENSFLK